MCTFSRQIAAGEEITVNYNGIIDGEIHRDQRRRKLFESYQFNCSCAACNISDEELKTQNEMCDELIATWNKKQQIIAREIAFKPDELIKYYKKLYSIAEKLNIFKRKTILQKIVEEGFIGACLVSSSSWDDYYYFAKIGLEISKVVHGKEQSETIQWEKRQKPQRYPIENRQLGNLNIVNCMQSLEK
jgi:hypothetical protein